MFLHCFTGYARIRRETALIFSGKRTTKSKEEMLVRETHDLRKFAFRRALILPLLEYASRK